MSSLLVNVCEVTKSEKHPNADKLSIVECNGWQCVVGLDQYKVGDVVIFIPPDSIVPENLIEKYELTYLKNGGRVGTAKLRGCISQGLVLGLDALPYGRLVVVGDNVADILGITKWEQPPVGGYSAGQANPISKRKLNPKFDKYTDIENIKNYSKVFANGDIVSVTEKIHGCLSAKTKLLLSNGTTKTIREIVDNKLEVELVGMSEAGELVPTKILNWFNNGITREWIKIKFKRRGYGSKGNSFGILVCTPNHQIFSGGKYVNANSLVVGDKVTNIKNYTKLSFIQESVLVGKMLGDGSLNSNCVVFGHNESQYEYVKYTLDCLGSVAGNEQKDQISGYGTTMKRGRSISNYSISETFKDWFVNNSKEVPVSIKLNPISLAFWYMDDGSLARHESQEDRACFATCGFSEDSVNNLIRSLDSSFGISAEKYFSKGFRLRLNAEDAEKLFIIIAPYVCDSMQYKLPERFRYKNIKLLDNVVTHYKKITDEQDIISIEKITNHTSYGITKYDIETGTHNYFANELLVHNCNFRAGTLPIVIDKSQPLLMKLKLLFKKYIKRDTHEFIYGSHNVQLHSGTKGKTYYGDDKWGQICKMYDLKNKIPNDYIVYGEMYGAGIQDLTYGLKGIDLVVFDIKYKNEYLPWHTVKSLCKWWGLPTVPELYTGRFYDGLLADHTDGKSTICPTQIREGCIIKDFDESNNKFIGRKILKSVSADYLLRKNGTEFR